MKLFVQHDAVDCGPACIKMIAKHYGKNYSLQYLRERSYLNREGVSLYGVSDAASAIGLKTIGAKLTLDQLKAKAILPCILHWEQNHFVVLYKIRGNKYYVADPGKGKVALTKEEFEEHWIPSDHTSGVLLLLEPTPEFYSKDDEQTDGKGLGFMFFHLKRHRTLVIQLLIALLVISLSQILFPFLAQSIVDVGVSSGDINFLELILVAQLTLFASQSIAELVRQWSLLHLGTRVSVALISDFLTKLMKLPIAFFDSKTVGDLFERVGDHHRIQNFISSSSLNILFGLFSVVVLSAILYYYSALVFLIFFLGSAVYFIFISLFLRKRKELDFRRFALHAKHQSALLQMLYGMTDIKISGAEKTLRWDWEAIQAKIFRVNITTTRIITFQFTGATMINETKNILITFLSATLVIKGEMTLGMMLAIQYIIGQLNGPINNAISFIHQLQDAKISLDRISEVRTIEEEKHRNHVYQTPEAGAIELQNLTFQYGGDKSPKILDDISLVIPKGKVTAIVGHSGSGKTTLLKLLLNIYQPTQGKVSVGNTDLKEVDPDQWRRKCGVVMQEGYIFSDTIAKNITIGSEIMDHDQLEKALYTANADEFIRDLPLGISTKIGSDGLALSQGQKQRILIARAIYNNPDYIFFDEATSALDAVNENQITEKLSKFFQGKTVFIIAHRLSTVKNADQIIVLDRGKMLEMGNHQELIASKGHYFNLIRNQLEVGR